MRRLSVAISSNGQVALGGFCHSYCVWCFWYQESRFLVVPVISSKNRSSTAAEGERNSRAAGPKQQQPNFTRTPEAGSRFGLGGGGDRGCRTADQSPISHSAPHNNGSHHVRTSTDEGCTADCFRSSPWRWPPRCPTRAS